MPPPTMFFVCGCPKSGTTWVQLMLDRHPDICCAGESQLVLLIKKISGLIETHNDQLHDRNRRVFGDLAGYAPFPDITIDDERALYRVLVTRLLDKAMRKPHARAVGDKTPNLVEHLSWFQTVAPEAKFIHVIRDGRDVAVSAWHHAAREPGGTTVAERVAFRDYALLMAQLWSGVIDGARSAAASMHGRYLEVRYEDLHRDPDATLARMFGFLGVSTDARIRRDCWEATRFERLTGGRPAGQEDKRAFLRKGVPGDWRNWFDVELNTAFVLLAESLLVQLGYPLLLG